MTTPLPPISHHLGSTHPLPPQTAHTLLSTFLALASSTSAYHPDSTLSERGPVSSTGNAANLTLHHLARIRSGIEGVRVGGELEDLRGETETGMKKRKRDEEDLVEKTLDGRGDVEKLTRETEPEPEPELEADWQDKDDYELAQDDEELDHNAERDPGGAGTEGWEETAVPEVEVDVEALAKVNKEERKRLKRLRREEENRKGEREGAARRRKGKGKKEE